MDLHIYFLNHQAIKIKRLQGFDIHTLTDRPKNHNGASRHSVLLQSTTQLIHQQNHKKCKRKVRDRTRSGELVTHHRDTVKHAYLIRGATYENMIDY